MSSVVAIIPARGGSKGLHRKNILPLAGRPLIAHSIDAARDCALIDRCLVSTEDDEIASVAQAFGADVMPRPATLAGDFVRTNEVVSDLLTTLDKRGERPDFVVLLQPTSPLRTATHVQACLEALFVAREKGDVASSLSVCESEHHPYKDLIVSEDGSLVPLINEAALETPRQKLPKAYRQNGAIYVVGTDDFLTSQRFYLPPALPFVMSTEESIDIDSAFDLRVAEIIMENRRG